jgi:hypothetical protein
MVLIRSQKRSLLGAAMVVVLSFSSVALAGYTQTAEVYFYTGTPGVVSVSGALDAARYSSDSNQYIGCDLYSWGIFCSATDAYNNYTYCSISGPTATQQQMVAGIGSVSYIGFDVTSATHVCASIGVSNYSFTIH